MIPPKKDNKYYVSKYGNYMAGRSSDEALANQTLPDSDKPYKQIVMEQAQKLGIKPEILFASLNEEGVRDFAKGKEYSGDDKYPVDGYAQVGLDTFGDAYPNLVKKGYLPANMDYSPVLGENEKGQKVHTANFKNLDDAVAAKAAMLKDLQDQVTDYSTKKGYNLTDQDKDFFMLAGYNGGFGNAKGMLDSYAQKGVLQNGAYLTQKPSSYGGIYDHVMRRTVPATAWKDDGIFNPPTQIDQPAVAQAPPTSQGQPIYKEGKPIAYIGADGKVRAIDTPSPANTTASVNPQ